MSPTRAASRGQLSRDVVVDRVLALAGAEGLDAVTVRRLATELDVTPMALYWHFRTKEDLLLGAADRLLDAVEVPDGSGSWQERLSRASTALVAAIRPHPQVAPLVKERMIAHPSGLALTELALGALADAGFSTADASQIAWHALATAVLLVTGDPVDDSGTSAEERAAQLRQKSAFIRSLPADQYPHLVAAADDMTHCHDDERFFTLGVELFVAGVEGLAPTKVRPARATAGPGRRARRTAVRN
ncbi:MAG TPA: TetR/AcrR family transcriptional regulator C-terminal domain-containing protein [Mycobacteriales bacterium]